MPNKNKQTMRKKSVAKKKMSPKRKVARKRAASKQSSLARKKVARIRAAAKRSLARNKKFSAKRKRVTSTGLVVETSPSVERREHREGQAVDLQALSNRPTASSESVEELLEEGNALEAEAVQGVENALDADQGEVETHEVPEAFSGRQKQEKNE
jgi:hypothetical protein